MEQPQSWLNGWGSRCNLDFFYFTGQLIRIRKILHSIARRLLKVFIWETQNGTVLIVSQQATTVILRMGKIYLCSSRSKAITSVFSFYYSCLGHIYYCYQSNRMINRNEFCCYVFSRALQQNYLKSFGSEPSNLVKSRFFKQWCINLNKFQYTAEGKGKKS